MDGVSFALALVATVDLCLKYGKRLDNVCKNYERADTQIREMLMVLLTIWTKIKHQLLVLQSCADALPDEFLILQNHISILLQTKLQAVESKVHKTLDGCESSSFWVKIKYATSMKESLQASIDDLENWYRRWDPSWMMIARLSSPKVDSEINKPMLSTETSQALKVIRGLRDARRANQSTGHHSRSLLIPQNVRLLDLDRIPLSAISLKRRSDTNCVVIVETILDLADTNEQEVIRDMQNLADTLSRFHPSICNLLTCEGMQKNPKVGGGLRSVSFIFTLANVNLGVASSSIESSQLSNLRQQLLEGNAKSLTYRVVVAKSMARSVIFLHSADFVHKNIRPETVLVTKSGGSYLVGFDRFRSLQTQTYHHGDEEWQKNIYRHPTRQGLNPEEAYTMLHDVYSLGVCLLEIGLWDSFVLYDDHGQVGRGKHAMLVNGPSHHHRSNAFAMQKQFKELALRELPGSIGEKYTAVVIACLTCLDKDSSMVVELPDKDGINIGVQYIEKVLNKLDEIAL